ncbi:plasminogen activator, urokinase a [Neolamprologus brichardi]|uniref:plasminogen activator, urokinase a n=1 Tax=Neolamprologus brichardi TaxID=32507 RepID=UPI0003EBE15C|nr:plasminogen activator, urokinase a [Neolamprologus brichardi]
MNLFVLVAILAAVSVDVAFSQRSSKQARQRCLSGDGSEYRGNIDKSSTGRTCLYWNKVKPQWKNVNGLGKHRYCRNPDNSDMPWCYVTRERRTVREYCDIPTCFAPLQAPPQLPVDTEKTCGETSERRIHKIVGGSFTPIESQPWVAAIFHKRYGFLCGGTLISPSWILTAAHCFSDGENTKLTHLSIYLGKSAINETNASSEQKFAVERLIMHEEYNDITYNNDIALIKLKSRDGGRAAKSASVRIACLPPFHTELPPGFTCTIAGFGRESAGSFQFSQYLKKAEVKLMSNADCSKEVHYGKRITENMFCAASPDWSTDACKGDSGGPLVCGASGRMFLFGVVSWGEGCALKNKPGVYTKVTNYNTWIAGKTGLIKYAKGLMYPLK